MFNFFKTGWQRSVRLSDAAIFPLAPNSSPAHVLGGVRHSALPYHFHHQRTGRGRDDGTVLDYLEAQPQPTERLPGHGLYAGPFFKHFGHFIAESVHRLWAYHENGGAFDYVAILPQAQRRAARADTRPELPGFQWQTLNYMQIPFDRIRLVGEPVIAADLTVPQQASILSHRVRRPQSYVDFWAGHEARFFSTYRDPLPEAREKIYVSRSNFLTQGGFAGERYLENQLEAEGFFILRPETYPLVEQLHLYRQARLLVFPEGSAIHTTELLGPVKADIVCLQRDKGSAALWHSVLDGRSHQLAFFDMVTPLPPLMVQASGSPAHRKTLCLLDGQALARYFRDSGIASLPAFDQNQFHLIEAADIARYVVHARMAQTFEQNQTTELLKAFKAALKAHDNPYLKETF